DGEQHVALLVGPGLELVAVVAEAVEHAVRTFPWPKSMRWGEGSLRWVRPLRRILCLLHDEAGATVVPFDIDGIAAGDVTEGHRVHAPGEVRVTSFEDYAAKLAAAHVVLDPEERADKIRHDATQAAFALGMELVEDEGLMREVAGLAEWPVVLVGDIAPEFLDLPPEVLQTSMREHQKFFSLRNPATGRIEKFVTVANLEAPDGGAAILSGNQRVLAARLADAKFFWENDLRTIERVGMKGLAAPLANVVFHEKLGTQADRVARIEALAREIAPAVGAKPDLAGEAASIAKADLASEMVFEFPELQGVMGRYYAAAAGHDDGVPEACETHYRPLGPTDAVPTDPVAVAVALADKIDMLTGFWAIDEKPTGSRDPFALRRAALGVIRILIENDVRHPIFTAGMNAFNRHIAEIRRHDRKLLLSETDLAAALGDLDTDMVAEGTALLAERQGQLQAEEQSAVGHSLVAISSLGRFIDDRLKVLLRDRGIRHDVIDAVAGLLHRDVVAVRVRKAEALQSFLNSEDGANLLAAYRRAANIVAKEVEKDGGDYTAAPDPARAVEAAERALFEALGMLEPDVAQALEAEDFTAAMAAMARLRGPVDAFFDDVTVNAEDPALRVNRLCLLSRLTALMAQVAVWDAIEG
ncbi:MAG: glycine--tRNA ligase subunit beta, partial [Pseudomonadota bacterium]